MTWHSINSKDIEKELNTDFESGLSITEAEKRMSKHGKNIITDESKTSFLKKFLDQFKDFMIIILLFAAGISFFTSIINNEADFADPIIILCIVVLNALIGVIQENKAEKSIEALKKISSPNAYCLRGGKMVTIPAETLVPGDIVILKTGNRVSADCRILSSEGIMTDESMLTGESMPVSKSACNLPEKNLPLAERKNMLWSGSMIIAGKGRAVVCETGMKTEMGNIASMIMSSPNRETPLQKKLSEIGRTLGIAALLICSIIFVIGLFQKLPPFEMFMTSVSLAVAAIPEGLPAIVTIMLALGVQRMAKLGAIIRNLPSVETLGCASVICSDKTGTLTQNKMTVVELFSDDERSTLTLAAICSDPESINPTEEAILAYAQKSGIKKAELDKRYKKISEIPFSSDRKKMSVSCRDKDLTLSVTKGAPDVILKSCTHISEKGKPVPISETRRKALLSENEKMAKKALRVIAVAYKNITQTKPSEEGLIFSGLIGLEDPPRAEVKEAVKICVDAGITPVMITGDHLDTALAIASQIGIATKEKKAITGQELESMTQEKLEKNISDYCVFARVTPEHKMRIVKAWQKKGEVVAMTGDGVNDAPALKCADIGCSMGLSGTDVAKNASDMILTDDNFATIVGAVGQGRGIYANIKKTIKFLLSSNIGEILTVFLGLLFGWQAPLIPIQLLWVNLVTDSLPAIALGVDPPDKYLMKEEPRPTNKSIFSEGLWISILLEGAIIGALALLAFTMGAINGDITAARTMAFCVLSMSQLVHAFNMRSEHSVFSVGIFGNKYLILAFLFGIILQCSVVTITPLAALFRVSRLSGVQWGIVSFLSVLPLVIVELQKLFTKLISKKE